MKSLEDFVKKPSHLLKISSSHMGIFELRRRALLACALTPPQSEVQKLKAVSFLLK